ncbi:MAG: hypothetical protein KIT83_14635 [Bryobacterales bacterium]|nr:hypothetical protein [Bryobacterales bacterium]
MKHSIFVRIALGCATFVCLLASLAAQAPAQARVATYFPPATTVGALPGQPLAVNITLQNFTLANIPNSGTRAYWVVEGGAAVGLSGQPGGTTATLSIPESLRGTPGSFPVVVCNFVNFGQGPVDYECTAPASSASFIINAPPQFTISATLRHVEVRRMCPIVWC